LTNAAFLSAFLFMSTSSIGKDQVNGVSVRFSRIWSRMSGEVRAVKVADGVVVNEEDREDEGANEVEDEEDCMKTRAKRRNWVFKYSSSRTCDCRHRPNRRPKNYKYPNVPTNWMKIAYFYPENQYTIR